jgi:hypothetical protein
MTLFLSPLPALSQLLKAGPGIPEWRGFLTEPTVANNQLSTINPPANFELGEGALNSLLNDAFKNPIVLGSGSEQIVVQAKKIKFDFETNSCTVSLQFEVRFDLGYLERTELVVYDRTLTTGEFTYNQAVQKVKALLPGFMAQYEALPSYVKILMKAQFQTLEVYSKPLLSNMAGSASSVLPATGAQIEGGVPMFYMGMDAAISFQNDFVRLSLSPILDIEDPKIEVYRFHMGSDVSFWIITNFDGVVSDPVFNVPLLDANTDNYHLEQNNSGDLRRRRFNFYTGWTPYASSKKFSATVKSGNAEYRIRTTSNVPANADGYLPITIK